MGTLRKALFWSAMQRFGIQGTRVIAEHSPGAPFVSLGIWSHWHVDGFLQCRSGFCRLRTQYGTGAAAANSADDEATVFYLNIGAGAVLTLLICAISPLVAGFYGQPVLIPLLCVLSLQVFLSSFGIVQFALLARAMDFRRLAIISYIIRALLRCSGHRYGVKGLGGLEPGRAVGNRGAV